MTMVSPILYQNEDTSVLLVDIPRSIELAQGGATNRRLISSKPLEQPYPSVEPKSTKAITKVKEQSIKELLLHKHLQLALDEVKAARQAWCLPRIVGEAERKVSHRSKRRKISDDETSTSVVSEQDDPQDPEPISSPWLSKEPFIHTNAEATEASISFGQDTFPVRLPPKSYFIHGDITTTLPLFQEKAPIFNLILLDPPWPNRSARRKQSYSISANTPDIRTLLSSLPIQSHLSPDGILGIWVTNKSAFHDLLLESGGIFEEWGLVLKEEWVWLKVTAHGEPIGEIASAWRKPYEILLVAGRNQSPERAEVKRRVIIGVPDLHSRKPNLKSLFEPMLPSKYEALEVFARNLTAGWWAWGNEVLKFQTEEHWTSPSYHISALDTSNTTL